MDEREIKDDAWSEVPALLVSLYRVVERLEAIFPGRKFTPDGHLVGSIGEAVAARMFDLRLLGASTPEHDATTADEGTLVQIKMTQGNRSVALRAEPEHLLVLRLDPDLIVEVVYNGAGGPPWSAAGAVQSNGQRPISLSRLRALDGDAPYSECLPVRNEVDLRQGIVGAEVGAVAADESEHADGSDREEGEPPETARERKRWTTKPGTIIALCALVVSIVTAWSLVVQGIESRNHYQKTVTPMVLADVSSNPVDGTWGIFLKNEGIGPAVINYESVTVDGQTSDWPTVLSKMRAEGALGAQTKVGYAGLRSGSYLGAGQRKMILEVDPMSLDASARTKLHDFIHERIDVRFEWCSVYDECEDGCTKEACLVPRRQSSSP